MKKKYFYTSAIIMLSIFMLPHISSAQQLLYGGNGNGSPIIPGAIVLISQENGSGQIIGDPGVPGGLSGLTFDLSGRLFGSTIEGDGTASRLIEIDPDSGELIRNIGPILDGENSPLSIGDLATQPGTGVIYAISSNNSSPGGFLYTINPQTALADFVGQTTDRACGLGFAPDGTLYCWEGQNSIQIVDPDTGNVIDTLPTTPNQPFMPALAVRDDGIIFGSCGGSSCDNPDSIFALDPETGDVTLVGTTGQGNVSDLAFRNDNLTRPIPTLSEWGLIAMAALLGMAALYVARKRAVV